MKKFKRENQEQDEISYYAGQLKLELGEEYVTETLLRQFQKEAKEHHTRYLDPFDFAQNFLEQQKRKIELQGIRTEEREAKEAVLEEHFEDRTIAKESDFGGASEKASGAATGYIARKKTDADGLPFMMKTAKKQPKGYGESLNSISFINEFITAPLYKRTLYDRAPIIEGVESDETDQVVFRSKFLRDFQTLSELTGGKEDDLMGTDSEGLKRLKGIEGVEKVFASTLVWGEVDIHAGNIGVMEEEGGGLVLAKIDHGMSATNFFTNPSNALEKLAVMHLQEGYQESLPLDVSKLKEAIDQIISISDEEIERLIGSRIDELRRLGISPGAGLTEDDLINHGLHDDLRPGFSLDDLRNYYVNHYKKQMEVMRGVSARLDIISRIDGFDTPEEEQAWKSGQWLQDVKGMDPLEWAAKNGRTIEGMSPEDWKKSQLSANRPAQGKRSSGLFNKGKKKLGSLRKKGGAALSSRRKKVSRLPLWVHHKKPEATTEKKPHEEQPQKEMPAP